MKQQKAYLVFLFQVGFLLFDHDAEGAPFRNLLTYILKFPFLCSIDTLF